MKRMTLIALACLLAVGVLVGCRTEQQNAVASALNADRTANHLHALAASDMLDLKAQAWAERLARDGYLHHSDLTSGVSGCWRRLGENVGYGSSVANIETTYMNSAPHRANILQPAFNIVGVGYARSTDGRTWTVQVFEQTC
jgi:uncharacterized protein YkwD